MLYDPKWEHTKVPETETRPSLAHFIAWLETKDPRGKYSFMNCNGKCLAGQYMAHCGVAWDGGEPYDEFCKIIGGGGDWARVPVLSASPQTFGGALKRAREYQQTGRVTVD